jgi:AraC-like DNA-binding protein
MDQSLRIESGIPSAEVADLLSALSNALGAHGDPAEERLRRVTALLRVAGMPLGAPKGSIRGGLAPWQVRKIAAHVQANLHRPILNEELAGLTRLTTGHFGHAFRKSVGDSPHAYVIRRRIERAQQLMLATATPLSQIALECGLADQAHLSRLFRRLVGERPRDWRQARMSAEAACAGVGSGKHVS